MLSFGLTCSRLRAVAPREERKDAAEEPQESNDGPNLADADASSQCGGLRYLRFLLLESFKDVLESIVGSDGFQPNSRDVLQLVAT